MATVRATHGTFWRQFRPLFAAGLVGVAGLVPLTITQLANVPANLPLPVPALAAVTLLQSSAFVAGQHLQPHHRVGRGDGHRRRR